MRRLVVVFLLVCAGAVLLAVPAAQAEPFEGVLKWRLLRVSKAGVTKVAGTEADADDVFEVPLEKLMSLHGEAVVTDATVYVKGSKIRAESTAREGGGYVITDLETGASQVVSPRDKKVTEVTPDDLKQLEGRAEAARRMYGERNGAGAGAGLPAEARSRMDSLMRPGAGSGKPPELEALDEKATINGLPAEAFEVKSGKTATRGWLTQEHPEVYAVLQEMERSRTRVGQGAGNTARGELARNGLPVRIQTLSEREYLIEDLVLIEAKPLSPELFSAPADFTRASTGAPNSAAPPVPPPAKKK